MNLERKFRKRNEERDCYQNLNGRLVVNDHLPFSSYMKFDDVAYLPSCNGGSFGARIISLVFMLV